MVLCAFISTQGDFCETSEQGGRSLKQHYLASAETETAILSGSTVATASEREYSDASASPRQPLAGRLCKVAVPRALLGICNDLQQMFDLQVKH